jgi:hypothetical protein
MAFFPSLPKKKPTATEPPAVAIATANVPDPEKEAIDHAETLRTAVIPRMDPTIERRVVRKLDWRLIPIVMGLCK